MKQFVFSASVNDPSLAPALTKFLTALQAQPHIRRAALGSVEVLLDVEAEDTGQAIRDVEEAVRAAVPGARIDITGPAYWIGS